MGVTPVLLTVAVSVRLDPAVRVVADAWREVVVDASTGADWPVPLSVNVGVTKPGTATVRLPVAAPAAVGVNCNAIVHEFKAAAEVAVEQVVPAGSIAKGLPTEMALKLIAALPLLKTVNSCGELEPPTVVAGKLNGCCMAGSFTMEALVVAVDGIMMKKLPFPSTANGPARLSVS